MSRPNSASPPGRWNFLLSATSVWSSIFVQHGLKLTIRSQGRWQNMESLHICVSVCLHFTRKHECVCVCGHGSLGHCVGLCSLTGAEVRWAEDGWLYHMSWHLECMSVCVCLLCGFLWASASCHYHRHLLTSQTALLLSAAELGWRQSTAVQHQLVHRFGKYYSNTFI